ncbi:unnamed protein product [Cuscuta campestris]|uniref:Endoglucanase n=1 Tax=Cuscuta campestris TaxID=132261 RepID=A0A484M493_9ASTE|nr:unnamed protein product [Cuscuta campestris]
MDSRPLPMILAIFILFSSSAAGRSSPAAANGSEIFYANNNNNGAASFDYKDALSKAILFFEGQRAGKLPSSQRVKWRGDSALDDGKPEKVKLSGGYYDAGDNVKFTWTMAFSVGLLSWSAIEYEGNIVLAGEMRHLREAIQWGSNFLINAHVTSKGSTLAFYAQVGEGTADHNCWERPEGMDTPRTLYKITPSSPGTELAAEAAAALAAASVVFQKSNPKYSTKLLQHSKLLFAFADQNRGTFSLSSPFYTSYSGFQDELVWAAAWLHKASGDGYYLDYVIKNQDSSHSVTEFSWDNKFAGAQTLLANEYYAGNKNLEKFKNDAEAFVCGLMPASGSTQIHTTPGGLLFTRDSSNLQYTAGGTMILFMYARMLDNHRIAAGLHCPSATFSSSQIKSFAKSQVDYILGNNPNKMSYMVGFGSSYPKQLHHRGSSIPSIYKLRERVECDPGKVWFNSPSPNPNLHTGAIVGGPDGNDHFTDVRSSYSQMEPTTYMNAAFVGSVAALQ